MMSSVAVAVAVAATFPSSHPSPPTGRGARPCAIRLSADAAQWGTRPMEGGSLVGSRTERTLATATHGIPQ